MKYDDASWHSDGDFPDDLPPEAGATHAGMFLAWALLQGMAGADHATDFPDELERLRNRQITPGRYLMLLDGKFTDEELDEEGNAFASNYFDLEKGHYLGDYEATLADGLPTAYHVADTWDNFDRLKPVVDKRYREWQAKRG